jgi:hypothetical protein
MIGNKYILWIYKHQLDAYKDQFGISHGTDVVLEEFHVTVVEEKEVRGMFGDGTYTGIKARTDDGENVFTRHWNSFPDDAAMPNYFWDTTKYKEKPDRPVDALLAVNLFLFVDANGERKIPVGVSLCEKHGEYFLSTCWKCDAEKQFGIEF